MAHRVREPINKKIYFTYNLNNARFETIDYSQNEVIE